jgi:protein-S-isoprenylcysteine O-methyltransferase Ste14
MRPVGSRLPSLGSRGEGWVLIQGVLAIALAISGLAGPVLDGAARTLAAVIGMLLIAAGITLGWGAIVRQRRQFTALPRPMSRARLVTDGPYRLVRHPMYGAMVLAACGWASLTASPPTCLLAILALDFFDLKSRREEIWLVEKFTDYDAYREHTRRLIPWVY